MRASWTPVPHIGPPHWALTHLGAWAQVMCTAAGLPPHHEGVTYL